MDAVAEADPDHLVCAAHIVYAVRFAYASYFAYAIHLAYAARFARFTYAVHFACVVFLAHATQAARGTGLDESDESDESVRWAHREGGLAVRIGARRVGVKGAGSKVSTDGARS